MKTGTTCKPIVCTYTQPWPHDWDQEVKMFSESDYVAYQIERIEVKNNMQANFKLIHPLTLGLC